MDKAKDDSQLEALIGATVLVALIVIFVPMLFDRRVPLL
jgi:cell division septation protein DedD